ncbi:MAG: competence/damage-inducible protein A [Ferrimicrobium sp.]
MQVEVVAVGSELLLGQIVDTNSVRIAQALAAVGISSFHQVRVGDNHERIVEVLRSALERSDAVIVCGGLGPTPDDITREAIAEVAQAPLEENQIVRAGIEELFRRRGRQMPANNLRQAMVPRGASVIEQRKGTAPGLIVPFGSKVIFALPGVPYELDEMLERVVIPELVLRSGSPGVIKSRVLRTWGVAESRLAELLEGRIASLEGSSSTTLAFLASGMEGIKVRITVHSETEAQANVLLDAEEAEIAAILGDRIFGTDDETLETVVAGLLIERGLQLAVAESLTGGMMASRAVGVPGASKWFLGGVVSYQNAVKREVLDVRAPEVVSERAACEMADGVARLLGADVAVATTGVAGPDWLESQAPGTVWIGIHTQLGTAAQMVQLLGDRERVRAYSVASAFDLLRLTLTGSARGISF